MVETVYLNNEERVLKPVISTVLCLVSYIADTPKITLIQIPHTNYLCEHPDYVKKHFITKI